MKRITQILGIVMFLLTSTSTVEAVEKVSLSTATLAAETTYEMQGIDSRVIKLQKFLESIGSPIASDAKHVVSESDRLGLDYRLVVAIAGNESYFGQHIPYNSFNAWGWAVYTGRSWGANFIDWKEGITIVSEGLRFNYIDDGLVTLDQIGHRYAADPQWSAKVRFFMSKIENFDWRQSNQLALSL